MDKVVDCIVGIVISFVACVIIALAVVLLIRVPHLGKEEPKTETSISLSTQVPSECKHIEFVNGGNTMLAFDDAKIEVVVSKTNIDDENNSVQFIVYKVNGYNCKSNRLETVEIVDSESLAIWFIR